MTSASAFRLAFTSIVVALATGCGEAPAPRGSAAADSARSAAPSDAGAGAARSAAAMPPPSASAPAVPSASASAPPPAAPVDLAKAPELMGPDGKPLPQTDDRPSALSAAFKERMALVFRAIVADDPALAEPAFFPKVAYEQVKDIEKPGADWKARLLKAFARNIHEYHGKLGDDPAGCKLLGVDVDESRVKLMARGKEGNKLPYYRVTRSKIRWADAAGKEKTFELTSLISWRGEWFVVHLHGFK
jgi:hypothetical protein